MAKEQLAHVRIYKKEHDILKRLAVRKSIGKSRTVTVAEIIRSLIKGV